MGKKSKSTIVIHGMIRVHSAIHKGAGLSATVQNSLWRLFLPAAPIHTQWDIFQWNGEIVPGKAGKP